MPVSEPAADLREPPGVHHAAALARGAFFNTVALIVTGLRAVFTLLVARLLGTAALGMFGVAWATTDLVSKVTTYGFDTSVMTFVARAERLANRAETVRIMRVALAIGLALSVSAAIIGFTGSQLLVSRAGQNRQLADATAVALLALPGIALYRISNAVSRGLGVMHHDIYSRGITDNLVTSAALLVGMALGARALAPEIAALAGALASGTVAYGCARGLIALDRGAATDVASMRPLLWASGSICAYDLLNIGLMQIDVIMLGLFVGRTPEVTLPSVGIYAAAAEAAGTLRKINQAFGPIFTTVVARNMVSRDIREAEASFAIVGRWMLTLLVPALVVFASASHTIMAIFGAEFTRGAAWLTILAAACALNAFVGLGETILTVERPELNLSNAVIVSIATILLNLILIPRFGPFGAALGMVVPYSAYGVLRVIQIQRLLDWRWPWRKLAKPIWAAALALPVPVALHAVGQTSAVELVATIGYLIAYGTAWRWIGFEETDRAMLESFLRGHRMRSSVLGGPTRNLFKGSTTGPR